MGIAELFLVAVGLSMDAFAVSICKGLSMRKARFRKALIVGIYFGVFQALMPLAGYFLGSQFADKITEFDHWIAFFLLTIIGGRMVWESRCKDEDGQKKTEPMLNFNEMLPLAVATSIDALAIGVSFAFLNVDIIPAISFIGIITLLLSISGVKIGNMFGAKYKSRAEIAGGVILVLIGLKILLEHLNISAF